MSQDIVIAPEHVQKWKQMKASRRVFGWGVDPPEGVIEQLVTEVEGMLPGRCIYTSADVLDIFGLENCAADFLEGGYQEWLEVYPPCTEEESRRIAARCQWLTSEAVREGRPPKKNPFIEYLGYKPLN